MDAFKLLTRSTKLARARSASDGGSRVLPSAGQTPRPQLFGPSNGGDVHESPPSPSRKRKRSTDLHPDLDFFERPTDPRHAKPSTVVDGRHPQKQPRTLPKEPDEAKDGPPPTERDTLGKAECEQLLREHKIKIIRLASSDRPTPVVEARAADHDGRKPSSSHSSRAKKHAEELFPQPLQAFSQLRRDYGISRRVAENLAEQGYEIPTEVQMGSLPLLLRAPQSGTDEFRSLEDAGGTSVRTSNVDLLAVAPTGSGKTLAFLIPILESLIQDKHQRPAPATGPKALILVPTKELLAQIVNEGRKLAAGTGIKVTGMRKGMKLFPASKPRTPGASASTSTAEHQAADDVEGAADGDHTDRAADGVDPETFVKADILVTTPLLFLHTIQPSAKQAAKTLPSTTHLVLDEADVLLDPLFQAQTEAIWGACSHPALRVSLWSATMGSSIEARAMQIIQARRARLPPPPTGPTPGWQLLRLVVGIKDAAVPHISHRLIYAGTERGKLLALRQLLRPSKASSSGHAPLRPPFLVFTQTIARALALHAELLYDIPPEAGGSARLGVLHAELSDSARDAVMAGFRRGQIWVLITTDVLSRGVDFCGVNGVVNYDIPNCAATYIHRGGRTGRAGRAGGLAVTLYTKEDIPYVKHVANVMAAAATTHPSEPNPVPQWLLDALPKPTKADKRRLKQHGVAARNAPLAPAVPVTEEEKKEKEKEKKKKKHGPLLSTAAASRTSMRISTKSGYDRRLEHRRRDARMSSVRRAAAAPITKGHDGDGGGEGGGDGNGNGDGDESEWNGFEDDD
ncbi:MAG: RNA-dependent ATPase rok1 [Phylliscum demangeonii]|nr:MAG: RNA-dependent ATPase rok1 [Phylliscum demangeonii]